MVLIEHEMEKISFLYVEKYDLNNFSYRLIYSFSLERCVFPFLIPSDRH